jgi:hypothetical protein
MDGVVSLWRRDLLASPLIHYLSYYPIMRTDESGTILDKEGSLRADNTTT